MNTYEIKLRFLEKEIVAFGVQSSSESAGWLNRATVIFFTTLIIVGAFGKNIYELYQLVWK